MPDTGIYLVAALAATFIIMGFLVLSMTMRYRNLQKDIKLIDQLKNE
ncbi:MAG: hypothetical protein K8L99_30005 [Anaerolineae bacterium]|nr:hypothetical protein [Anaerolineae bacterium]